MRLYRVRDVQTGRVVLIAGTRYSPVELYRAWREAARILGEETWSFHTGYGRYRLEWL